MHGDATIDVFGVAAVALFAARPAAVRAERAGEVKQVDHASRYRHDVPVT
jgi:hypothetical protein